MTKDNKGHSVFHNACIGGHFNIVEYLLRDLKLVFLTEQLDDDNNTALHHAANNGHTSIAELLLLYDPKVDFRNNENCTPLELSCRKNFFDISKLLIGSIKSIDVDETTVMNMNPLHIAAQEGAHEVVELLLAKGFPINMMNMENKNAMDIAMENQKKEVVQVLLKNRNWKRLINHEPKKSKLKKPKFQLDFKKMVTQPKSKVKFIFSSFFFVIDY